MDKIIIMIDENDEKQTAYANAIVDKHSVQFDIFVATDTNKPTPDFIYYLITANYFIITDKKSNPAKWKRNQQVYFVTDEHHTDFYEKNKALLYADHIIDYDHEIKFEMKKTRLKKDIIIIQDQSDSAVTGPDSIVPFLERLQKDYEAYNIVLATLNNQNATTNEKNSLFTSVLNARSRVFKDYFYSLEDAYIIYSSDWQLDKFGKIIDLDKDKYTLIEQDKLKLFFSETDIEQFLDTAEAIEANSIEYKKRLDAIDVADKKISIIICHYNIQKQLFYRAIQSALDSTHKNIEVIVVDDGSETSLEAETLAYFNDDRLKYFYKQNEGLGLSRNFGVRNCTGDYVFFLDSDDTIEPHGLDRMLAHMTTFGLECVVGRRVVVVENGEPISESLNYLYGNMYRTYFKDVYSTVYYDQMPNNKLLTKQAFEKYDLWFEKGLYEDALFTAKIFSRISTYHYIHIHNWYKYDSFDTLSSTKSYNNFLEKINTQEQTWSLYPTFVKKSMMHMYITNDYSIYYTSCLAWSEQDRRAFFEKVSQVIHEKKAYFDDGNLPLNLKLIYRAIAKKDYDTFINLLTDWHEQTATSDYTADNYVVFTHYHILQAITHAINNKRSARLFFYTQYVGIEKGFVEKISVTGVFEQVKSFEIGRNVGDLLAEMKRRPDEAATIVPNYLYPMYKDLFAKCRPDDRTFVFSDRLPFFYFIHRYFDHVYTIEDAYDSFKRQTQLNYLGGMWGEVVEMAGGVIPPMYGLAPKMKEIIVSKPIDLGEAYKDKLRVIDFKELLAKNKDQVKEAMLKIYDVDTTYLTKNTVMIITQPLHRGDYCTLEEEVALHEAMAHGNKKSDIVIKPHPADNFNYRKLGYRVLPKNTPIELYNLVGIDIKKVVTFGSSSIWSSDFAREKVLLFKMEDFSKDDVTEAVLSYIKKMPVGLKIKVKYRTADIKIKHALKWRMDEAKKMLPQSIKKPIKNILTTRVYNKKIKELRG